MENPTVGISVLFYDTNEKKNPIRIPSNFNVKYYAYLFYVKNVLWVKLGAFKDAMLNVLKCLVAESVTGGICLFLVYLASLHN